MLLETRQLLLAKAGIKGISVYSLGPFEIVLTMGTFDLLLLCHTLSSNECESALMLASHHPPAIKTLILRPEGVRPTSDSSVQYVNLGRGPAELVAALNLFASQASNLPPRRTICRSMMDT